MDMHASPGGVSRRQFLGRSLGGAALLQLGALLPSGCAGYPPLRTNGGYKVLNAKSAAIVEALADAVVDADAGALPVPSRSGIAAKVDAMLAGLHPETVDQSLLLFNVFEHMTLPFGFYGSRFTKLPRAEQRAYLEGWANSGLGFRRMAAQALKMFVYVNYYALPETFAHLGYDGPWVGRFEMPAFEPPLAKYTEKEPL